MRKFGIRVIADFWVFICNCGCYNKVIFRNDFNPFNAIKFIVDCPVKANDMLKKCRKLYKEYDFKIEEIL